MGQHEIELRNSAACDPVLLAVQDVAIRRSVRASLHRRRVRPSRWFCKTDCGLVASQHEFCRSLFLSPRPISHDRRHRAHVAIDHDATRNTASLRGLFHSDTGRLKRRPLSAEFGRDRHANNARFSHDFGMMKRIRFGAVNLRRCWAQMIPRNLLHDFADVVVRKFAAHQRSPVWRFRGRN